jgi:SAM-dependent methyltransferase
MSNFNAEAAVRERYAAGAKTAESKLCCPVDYDRELLKVIPQEVIDRDYGCGDPSKYLREGETVLDLGSGAGKICFMAAQVVGPKGKVIGVDMTDEMLEVARRNAPVVAKRIRIRQRRPSERAHSGPRPGSGEIGCRTGRGPSRMRPLFPARRELAQELRIKHPLVATESVDVVVSNCVLNLVEPKSKRQLFEEMFRVLRKGARAVVSDIVSDEDVPEELQNDPELWSGCISGALTEEGLLAAFETAGFYGIQLLKRDATPWRTVRGIEFRSVTVEAFKGKQGPCFERNQAVIYRGPFKEVLDDDNHRMERGHRYAVCDKTYHLYKKARLTEFFEFVDPLADLPLTAAKPFDCSRTSLRHPKETKGQEYKVTTEASSCCDGGSCS